MPGGDGTGPAGMGPMTGRAAGYCAGYYVPGYANLNAWAGWNRFGYGRARVRNFGWRGGFYSSYAYGYPYMSKMTPQQEAEMLSEQAKAIQEDISSINERIKELKSVKKPEDK